MKRCRVALDERAQADMEFIRRGRKFARKRTDKLLAEIRRVLLTLSRHPLSHERWGEGRRRATAIGHCIVYEAIPDETAPDTVLVVGVLDGRAAERLERLRRAR